MIKKLIVMLLLILCCNAAEMDTQEFSDQELQKKDDNYLEASQNKRIACVENSVSININDKEFFTGKSFFKLIDLHNEQNNELIIAEVKTDQGIIYYDAHYLNKSLFGKHYLNNNYPRIFVDPVPDNPICDPSNNDLIINTICYYISNVDIDQNVTFKFIGHSNELSNLEKNNLKRKNELRGVLINNMLFDEANEIIAAVSEIENIDLNDSNIIHQLTGRKLGYLGNYLTLAEIYLMYDNSEKKHTRVHRIIKTAKSIYEAKDYHKVRLEKIVSQIKEMQLNNSGNFLLLSEQELKEIYS
ncbi:MAG: DUF5092 domain-containing protein [Candidatus Babeliales bacterium]|nr:DUF5092 domain-containing protein [Candidatus Babeliales bacterium]